LRSTPVISGSLDLAYLRAALARAGRPADLEELQTAPLTDGRSGADVLKVTARRQGTPTPASWVVKRIDPTRGFAAGMGSPREVELWRSGAKDSLPAPLGQATIDVARHEDGPWWILMEDVSAGIVPPGKVEEEHAERLLRAMALLHARYWGQAAELAGLRLASVAETTRVLSEVTLAVGRGQASEPWVESVVASFVGARILPHFLEVLGPSDADFYLGLAANREPWLRALARHEPTFLHGDLRRANLAFFPDRLVLLDWDLASVGPAAVDLQWYWLLTFWAYPPSDNKSLADRMRLRDIYLAELEAAIGGPIDRVGFGRSWELAWIRCLTQIGFTLADRLTSPDVTPDDRARVARLCKDAIGLARRTCDRGFG
jgi:hypothetical protein